MLKKIFLFAVLLAVTAGCSKADFSQDLSAEELASRGSGAGGSSELPATCTEELQTITVPVKVILSVDTSGSNGENPLGPATDPDKQRRGGAMQNFFDSYKSRNNFYWGLQLFQDDFSASVIAGDFAGAAGMQAAIDYFYQVTDQDGTPYVAAIERIKRAVSMDQTATADTKYIIVFVSDGKPDPEVAITELQNKVAEVTSVAPGRVSFNTIYYGPTNTEATSRLKAMASTGGGAFYDASNGANIAIIDAVRVPGSSCN